MKNSLTTYEREALTALYVSLDFMKCNGAKFLDYVAVEAAISLIEDKTKAAA